ncbi:MAG: hypothetical protein CMO01_32325 [Thalassobius sp.]|nr:hypothetical protein [Thalassovita sp.]
MRISYKNSFHLFLLIALVFQLTSTQAQVKLSHRAKISVFTIAPGGADDELFTQFGHSAFRVFDPMNRIDWIYDYGVFDFDAPNFYLKFARGKLNYMLAKRDYKRFLAAYQHYNRSLTEQVLNLDSAEMQQVFDYLETNYLPENRYYLYDFFYDNCATKIPLVIEESLGDKVQFDRSPTEEDRTFRDLIEPRLVNHRWGDLGIDLALGLPTDKIATRYQYMFLPYYVEIQFAKAKITHHGETEPLVSNTRVAFEALPDEGKGTIIGPGMVFGALLVLVIGLTYLDFFKKKRSKWLDFTLFLIAGLIGLLLFFLWFLTDHKATHGNLNIIWAFPTHLVFAIFLLRKNIKNWVLTYALVTAVVLLLLVLSWFFLPQPLHYSVFPVVIALGIRAFYIWFYHNKISNS